MAEMVENVCTTRYLKTFGPRSGEVDRMDQNNYLWHAVYWAAVCETDDEQMPGRILEALAAIEQRLLTPSEIDAEELKAINNAQDGLEGLKAERVIKEHRSTYEPASDQPSA
jgi:hypothetical protein